MGHYSPTIPPPPPLPSFPYLKMRRSWVFFSTSSWVVQQNRAQSRLLYLFYDKEQLNSPHIPLFFISKRTSVVSMFYTLSWSTLFQQLRVRVICELYYWNAKQNRTDYAYKTTSRYNTSRLVRISLLIIAINCNFFSGKLALQRRLNRKLFFCGLQTAPILLNSPNTLSCLYQGL